MSTVSLAAEMPDFKDGVMLCVRPNDPGRFVVEGGTPEDDMHCTLLFFGNIDEFDGPAASQAAEVLGSEVAPSKSPISGEITAVTTFDLAGEESPSLVLLVDAPGLSELRADCLKHLRPALADDTQPKLNHDFLPHMTLCYGPSESDLEFAKSLVGEKVEFNFIELVHGTEVSRWNLGDGNGKEGVIVDGEGDSELTLEEEMAIPQPEASEERDIVPYEVVENDPDCGEEFPFGVRNTETGEHMGCNASRDEAEAHIAAMMAHEADACKKDDELSVDPLAIVIEMSDDERHAQALATLEGFIAGGTDSDEVVEFRAIQSHDSSTSDASWDGPANETRVKADQDPDYFRKIYAWQDPEGNERVKAAYRFIHHEVSEDGTPGAANLKACSTGIGVLNGGRGGTTIPEADRKGVYDHLAAHLRDAEANVPELMSASTEDHQEMTAEAVEFAALPVHHTETTDSREFDGDVAKTRSRSDETPAYYNAIYAWHDSAEPPGNKTSYRFPHHMVSLTGEPGPAVTWAVHSSIMLIDESTIPESDYEGVYRHLAAHLEDAGLKVPKLGADNASVHDVRSAIAELATMSFDVAPDSGDTEVSEFDVTKMEDVALVGELVRRWVESVSHKDEASSTEQEFAPKAGPMMKGSPDEDEDAPSVEIELELPGEEPSDDDEEEDVAEASKNYEWEAIMIVEGIPSGDGRMIEAGALTWRDLPLPLMLQTVNAEGHKGAVIAGSIHEIERQGQNIVGRGNFDSGPAGQEARRLAAEGTMRGVSADIDSVQVTLQDSEGNDVSMEDAMFGDVIPVEVLTKGRIMGLSMVPFPAFMEAFITVVDPAEDGVALAASGSAPEGELWMFNSPYELAVDGVHEALDLESIVASGSGIEIPLNPPNEWFSLREMDAPMPFTVYPDGRIYGLVAQFGTCHIGFRNRCVDVPRSMSSYRYFRNKNTLTAEGDLVATGPIFMNTVHPNLRLKASDAEAHYADTGCAVADVALYENEFGIVAAGAVRPSATPEQVRALRGSDVSPDWRSIKNPNGKKNLELVGLLAVNVSGFPVALAASAGEFEAVVERLVPRAQINLATDEIESLVAAGSVRECRQCGSKGDGAFVGQIATMLAAQDAKIAELAEAIRPYRVERLEARLKTLTVATLANEGD